MAIEKLINNNYNNPDSENLFIDTKSLIELKSLESINLEAYKLVYELYSKTYMQKYNLNVNELNKNLSLYSKYYKN